jgi:molybdopterin-containing oxidoreductase family membrane subunit
MRRYWLAVALLAALGAAGWAAVAWLAASGSEPRAKWGYTAATLAFVLSTAHGAPVLAFAARLARGYWGVPVRRAAELFGVAGLATAPLTIVLLFQLPDWRSRPSIWLDWPGAPRLWDGLAVTTLALCGLLLLYLGGLPDLSAAGRRRDQGRPPRLALGWAGTARQWVLLQHGLIALGGLYLMAFTFVHLLVVSDLAMSLVPEWGSASLPAHHAVSGLQGGVAVSVLALGVLRWLDGGAGRPAAGRDAFAPAAKLLLALALLWFYFFWAEFLTYWYGRTPAERQLLALLAFGPYALPFAAAFALTFLLPFLILLWNPVRNSVAGATSAAALVVAGVFFDRVRLFVPAWSLAGAAEGGHALEALPPAIWPRLPDALVMAGVPATVLLLYLLALRMVPAISWWEWNAAHLLRVERPFLRRVVTVIAQPS